MPDGFDGVVLVHDAARPFVEVALIEAVARAAHDTGAALPVLPLVDTIKRLRGGQVAETLERAELGEWTSWPALTRALLPTMSP